MLYDITTYRIVRLKKGENTYIEKHSHKDYFHYMYILNGTGRVIINNNEITLSKYDMMLAPPDIEHEIFAIHDLITLDIKFICSDPMYSMLMNIGYCMRGLTSYEDTLIRDIFDEAVNQRPLYNYAIDTKLLEFLFRVIRRERQGIEMVVNRAESSSFLPESGSQFSAKIQPVIDHIKTNVNNKFTISELADLAGYSENYFSSLFKECTGYPPNKYINILKVKKAKERILYTSDSITQISEELGFESVHYFSKVFKQITGMSPSNYVDRSKINMVINMIKDSPLLPQEGQYEFQLKNIDERVDN